MKKGTLSFDLAALFRDKRVRFGGYAALVTLAAIVAVVIINLIFQQLPAQVDMTKRRLFTLSEQTIDLIDSIENDVVMYALYTPGREDENVIDVMNKYARASRLIHLEFIDPDREPVFLQKYAADGVSLGTGTIVVESGEWFKVIPASDLYSVSTFQGQQRLMGFTAEQRFTNALLYVTSGVTPKVYVVEGHSEFTLDGLGIRQTVEKENYATESLNLLTTPEVPADADIVLVLSPEFDLAEREAEALLKYLENDGSAMFFFDFNGADLTRFNELLGSFGVRIGSGIVMESDKSRLYSPDNPLWLAPNLIEHEVTTPLITDGLTILMPTNLPVLTEEIRKRNLIIEPLLQSSEKSWIRTTLDSVSIQQIPSDESGPIDLVVAISRQKVLMDDPEGFRIIVAGNAGFVGNIPYLGIVKSNVDLFLNGLGWLNKRSDSISLRSKSLFQFPLRIPVTMQLIYAGIFVIVIPLIILALGLVVWLRRRHL